MTHAEQKLLQQLNYLTTVVLELQADTKAIKRTLLAERRAARSEVQRLRKVVADLRAEIRARGRLGTSLSRLTGDEPDRFEYVKNQKFNHNPK